MNPANFLADFNKIEEKIGLPVGFIIKLMKEDDWSFAIKTHAMIEAFITDIILQTSKEPFNSRMNFMDKLERIRNLELLDSQIIEVIKEIAYMRNAYAHGVKGFSMTLGEYFSQNNNERREQFAKKISQLFKGSKRQVESNYYQDLIDNSKLCISIVVLYILAEIFFKTDPSHKIEAEDKVKQLNEVLETIKNNPTGALIMLILIMIGANTPKVSLVELE